MFFPGTARDDADDTAVWCYGHLILEKSRYIHDLKDCSADSKTRNDAWKKYMQNV